MKTTPILRLALLTLALAAWCTAGAVADEAPLEKRLATAWQDLEQLETLLDDDNATQNELVTYMDIAVRAARELRLPALSEKEEEALSSDARRTRRKMERSLTRLHDEVHDLLLDALDDAELDRMGRNEREGVNKRAGALLAQARSWLDDEDDIRQLARRIIRKIKRLERARYDVHADVFEGAFTALAKLGDERGLRFLMSEYLHARKQPTEVARLRASLRSLRHFEAMPAKERHALVDEMLKLYVANEALAAQSSTEVATQAAKRFWDAIRVDAIALMQYLTGFPRDGAGRGLATMAAFAAWFREHDNPRKAPWTEPLSEPT